MLGYILNKVKLKTIFYLISSITASYYILQRVYWYSNGIQDDEYPIILWWTPFMVENERIISCFDGYECKLTKNRDYCNHTKLAAHLFYGSKLNLTDLPNAKNASKWAILHEESPRNEAIFLYKDTWDSFDITSTFSRHSDIPITLQYLSNLSIITDTHYVIKVEDKNKHLNRIAPILYVQSNCDTPNDRDAYILELMKFVRIDSYGTCLNNKKFPHEYRIERVPNLDLYNDKFLRFIAEYKFVIAFENAICDDYITEKLWRPLVVGSIPIYLGSPTIEDWLPNQDAAILVKNFKAPAKLAEFIKTINDNDDLYKEFLKHKSGIVTNDLLKSQLSQNGDFDNPVNLFECFVCKTIIEGTTNMKKQTKSVYNCTPPAAGNSWQYHWKSGKCQSRILKKFIETGRISKGDCS